MVQYRIDKLCNNINKKWRKCMGIEPTWEGTSPPHRIWRAQPRNPPAS